MQLWGHVCEKEEGILWRGLANQPHLQPIIQMEREEEKTPENESVLKTAQLIFVLHSSKDLNENHET